MSTQGDSSAPLRVGGWIPPQDPASPESSLPPEAPTAGAADTVVLHLPAPADTPTTSGPRRPVLTACAALGVLIITGIAAYTLGRPGGIGTPRFMAQPPASTAPAATPATTAPASAHAAEPLPSLTQVAARETSTPAAAASPSAGARSKPATSKKPAASATPTTQAPHRGPLPVGSSAGLEPSGMPGYRLRHRNHRGRVDRITTRSSALDRADSTFAVRAGLADDSCVSLESTNYPGQFLRHRNSRLWLDRRDGSALYAADATFCPVEGRLGDSVLLRSKNYPDRYLAVRHGQVSLSRHATPFTVRPAL
ncbi:AbfB domain-containing protein [Mangrovihabitans endophyticus]|uniref:Alpha-L-arabinofuranosidase B arabinose-binding domain-containing protein n=1 Tax=Mangrovihabitans endophyticus TaxID=1751298 RepID=A0A8J3FR17_9ACTN|nr:AbfB domain-containing protein [Mangrovihabitans endophyticus]GGL08104.1 hypothetical protein GCM10012284_48200 [Mangrovihabitans endophyticus]